MDTQLKVGSMKRKRNKKLKIKVKFGQRPIPFGNNKGRYLRDLSNGSLMATYHAWACDNFLNTTEFFSDIWVEVQNRKSLAVN